MTNDKWAHMLARLPEAQDESPAPSDHAAAPPRQADVLYARLTRLIRDGALVAGDELPSERTMSLAFGMSRGSIRSTLQRMQAGSLVRVEHGRPTRVIGSPGPARDGVELASITALGRLKTALRHAGFEVEKGASLRPALQRYEAALDLLREGCTLSTAVVAVDICHASIVEMSPPTLAPQFRAALDAYPMRHMRRTLARRSNVFHIRQLLRVALAAWVSRHCDGTKQTTCAYLTHLEEAAALAAPPLVP